MVNGAAAGVNAILLANALGGIRNDQSPGPGRVRDWPAAGMAVGLGSPAGADTGRCALVLDQWLAR